MKRNLTLPIWSSPASTNDLANTLKRALNKTKHQAP